MRINSPTSHQYWQRRPFSNQSGLSSIEMVMVLPFLLILFLLVGNISAYWHTKLDKQIQARTSAWRQARFASVPCSKTVETFASLFRNGAASLVLDLAGETGRDAINLVAFSELGQACEGYSRSTKLIEDMSSGGEFTQHKTGLAEQFSTVSVQPHAITGRAYYLWGTWGFNRSSTLFLEESHVVDINGQWLRASIPLGHDEYLRKWLIENNAEVSTDNSDAEILAAERSIEEFTRWGECHSANEELAEEDKVDCGEQPTLPF